MSEFDLLACGIYRIRKMETKPWKRRKPTSQKSRKYEVTEGTSISVVYSGKRQKIDSS